MLKKCCFLLTAVIMLISCMCCPVFAQVVESDAYQGIHVENEENIIIKNDGVFRSAKIVDGQLISTQKTFSNLSYLGNNKYVEYGDNNTQYIYDNNGRLLCKLTDCYFRDKFQNGYIIFYNVPDFSVGVMDSEFNIILEPIYDDLVIGVSSVFYASTEGTWYEITQSAQTKLDAYRITRVDTDVPYIVIDNKDESRIYKSENFALQIEHYNDVLLAENNFIVYHDGVTNYNIYNTISQSIVSTFSDEYSLIDISNEGYLLEKNFVLYYYDYQGNNFLSLEDRKTILNATAFHENYAVASIGNFGYSYINMNGDILTEKGFSYCSQFNNGHAVVITLNNEPLVINDEFNIVCTIDSPQKISDTDFWYVLTNNNNSYTLLYLNEQDVEKEHQYTLSLYSSDNQTTAYKVYYIAATNTIALPNCNETPDGYTFSHWTDGETTYAPGDIFIMPDHDVTLTAVWTKNPTYTITFAPNGGTGSMDAMTDLAPGSSITVPECTFTYDGYTFSHWSDGTGTYQPGDTYTMPEQDVTFTAVWEAIPVETYTVSFDANGGSGVMSPIEVTAGQTITVPECTFTRVGYTFSHWSENGTTYRAGDSYTVTDKDVTFQAEWTKNASSDDTGNNSGNRFSWLKNLIQKIKEFFSWNFFG